MRFEIIGSITGIETFASGSAIREIARLRKAYGRGRWRKRKGIACIRFPDGNVFRAELHLVRGFRDRPQSVQGQADFGMKMPKSAKTLVLCLDNAGYAASLERRKVYVTLADADAERRGLLRVIDESGEDYLYPKAAFAPIDLPLALRKAVMAAA